MNDVNHPAAVDRAAPVTGRRLSGAGVIAAVYLAVAGLWILLSDRALVAVAGDVDPGTLTRLQTGKGWFFVAATAGMLYVLVRRRLGAAAREAAAREAIDRRYRDLFEMAEEGIWAIDADERTTLVNRKMAEMLGYSEAEMMGAPLRRFMDDDAWTHAQVCLAKRRAGERGQHDFRFRHKDGRDVWTRLSAGPIVDEAGAYAGVLAMVTDVTDRRAAERRLAESEDEFRRLFDATPAPMFVYALPDLAILAVNDAAVANYGWTREEFLGMNAREIRPAEDVAQFEEVVRTAAAGLAMPGVFRHRRKDGTVFHVRVASHPHRYAGRAARLAVALDISDQVRAEGEARGLAETLEQRVRERTAELEAARADLEAYNYTVSHALREPLRGLRGMAAELVSRLDGRETGGTGAAAGAAEGDERELLARRLVGAAARMEGLVQDVLDFTHAAEGELQREPLSFALTVNEVAGDLRRTADYEGVEFHVVEPLPWVMAHRLTLWRVVTMLLRAGAGGAREARDPTVRVWASGASESPADVARMWVEDTGPAREMDPAAAGILTRTVARLGGRMAVVRTTEGRNRVRLDLPLVRHPENRMH